MKKGKKVRDDELYVMLMLQRSEENGAGVDCDDEDIVLVCLQEAADGKYEECPAACRVDEDNNNEDEVVKSGDLDVTANANNGSIIVGVPSDTDTLTFKTSEEVEVTKVTLKRYGFSSNTDIANVWLEDGNGKVISNKKTINSKGLTTLTIDKDYRTIDGTLNATIVVQTRANLTGAGVTMGFKVTEVESTAANTNLPSKDPTTYGIINYDGSKVVVSTRGGNNDYNYAEGELYEIAKFKVKAADDAAILVNGFTLTETGTTIRLNDVIDDVVVAFDDVEVKGLEYSTDKTKVTVSFDDVEIAAKQSATITLSVKLTDFDTHFGENILLQLADTDFNAIEETTKVRVSLTDSAYAPLGNLELQTNTIRGGKVKYTNTRLSKVEVEAGTTNVVIAEGNLEIPEAVNATFSIPADHTVIEEMRMYVAGEEFDGVWNTNKFDFDVELTKSGKVQFKVDIDEDAAKGTKISLNTLALSDFASLTYDSNGASVAVKGEVAGSISFADITVTKAKASLENNIDDTVEYLANETNRKTVFDGTYTAKKADSYLNGFSVAGNTIRNGENVTFYLILDGNEVSNVKVASGANAGDKTFGKVKVEANKSINVKVEAEVQAADTATTADYVYSLALSGVDVDDGDINIASVPMANFAVVMKGSIKVSSASSKKTVLLKAANSKIAEFTVKPEKANDDGVYLEDIVLNIGDLTASDITVKIDGVPEDGIDAPLFVTKDYNTGDYVSVSGEIREVTGFVASGTTIDSTNSIVLYSGASTTSGSIVYDLDEELNSNGVVVTVEIKNKADAEGTVTLNITSINGDTTKAKSYEKRFEKALVYVANQIDKKGATQFVLGVEKSENDIDINGACLWYNNGTTVTKECTNDTSVTNENDDIEIIAVGETPVLIEYITYSVSGSVAGNTCTTGAMAGCVSIDRATYTDYFKVGDTYAKVFGNK